MFITRQSSITTRVWSIINTYIGIYVSFNLTGQTDRQINACFEKKTKDIRHTTYINSALSTVSEHRNQLCTKKSIKCTT